MRLSRPERFDRITAVLVNADTREGGFSARQTRLGLPDGNGAVPAFGALVVR